MKITLKRRALNTLIAGLAFAPLARAVPPMMEDNPMAAAGSASGSGSVGALTAASPSPAPKPAPVKAKRPWGTIAQAPWIATMDRIAGSEQDLVHLIGEFGNDPRLLTVRFDGKAVPFKMVNSSLLLARPADVEAVADVEVQLGELAAYHTWHRGAFPPSTELSQFLAPSGGSMGMIIALSEERDLRPDHYGRMSCWGSRTEVYRLVDYNWMVAKAYGIQAPYPCMTAGYYSGKAELPVTDGATAAAAKK